MGTFLLKMLKMGGRVRGGQRVRESETEGVRETREGGLVKEEEWIMFAVMSEEMSAVGGQTI